MSNLFRMRIFFRAPNLEFHYKLSRRESVALFKFLPISLSIPLIRPHRPRSLNEFLDKIILLKQPFQEMYFIPLNLLFTLCLTF